MATENTVARALIKRILNAGYMVSVFDGGAWPLKFSTDADEIFAALNSTGEDSLSVRDAGKARVGSILLIWGNEPDGSELIADHSDNEVINQLVEGL